MWVSEQTRCPEGDDFVFVFVFSPGALAWYWCVAWSFVSVVMSKENLSFAIPMIIMSILSFITLKSIVRSLNPKWPQ